MCVSISSVQKFIYIYTLGSPVELDHLPKRPVEFLVLESAEDVQIFIDVRVVLLDLLSAKVGQP